MIPFTSNLKKPKSNKTQASGRLANKPYQQALWLVLESQLQIQPLWATISRATL